MVPTPTSITSPQRRVLADKTTNASLSNPVSHSNKQKIDNAVERVQYQKPATKEKPSVPVAGHKRTISQVEDFEQQPATVQNQRAKETDAPSVHADDKPPSQDNNSPGPRGLWSKTSLRTTFSFHASQEPEAELETTFDIQEDAFGDSQVEKLNATHIPRDDTGHERSTSPRSRSSSSPQSNRSLRTIAPGGSQDSLHLSSFLDFSQNDADNKSFRAITPPSAKGQKAAELSPEEAEARRTLIAEKAALLRTNLQLAYHKIQTNQTTTPFRKLRPPPKTFGGNFRKSTEPSLPPFPSLPVPRLPHVKEASLRTTQHSSPESRIAAARATATAQLKPVSKSLHSIPEPRLLPTSYSARWADQPGSTHDMTDRLPPTVLTVHQQQESKYKALGVVTEAADARSPPIQLPSSPPPSNREPSNLQARLEEDNNSGRSVTPTPCSPAKRKTMSDQAQTPTQTPVQLSSPPGSCEGSPPLTPRGRLGSE